jgi:hypothetical protein
MISPVPKVAGDLRILKACEELSQRRATIHETLQMLVTCVGHYLSSESGLRDAFIVGETIGQATADMWLGYGGSSNSRASDLWNAAVFDPPSTLAPLWAVAAAGFWVASLDQLGGSIWAGFERLHSEALKGKIPAPAYPFLDDQPDIWHTPMAWPEFDQLFKKYWHFPRGDSRPEA